MSDGSCRAVGVFRTGPEAERGYGVLGKAMRRSPAVMHSSRLLAGTRKAGEGAVMLTTLPLVGWNVIRDFDDSLQEPHRFSSKAIELSFPGWPLHGPG